MLNIDLNLRIFFIIIIFLIFFDKFILTHNDFYLYQMLTLFHLLLFKFIVNA
jgi:hypothetical protein